MSTVQVTNADHVQGPTNAPVVVVEYGDYQCPYCRQAYYIVKNLQKRFGDDLQFVFRNFPLEDLHPYALHAALAAETAAIEGKFWEMHGILFENQRHLDDLSLLEYAKKTGVDAATFEKEFGNEAIRQKVADDVASGANAGVEGTPYFFVNGALFEGNWTSEEFAEYLEALIG